MRVNIYVAVFRIRIDEYVFAVAYTNIRISNSYRRIRIRISYLRQRVRIRISYLHQRVSLVSSDCLDLFYSIMLPLFLRQITPSSRGRNLT